VSQHFGLLDLADGLPADADEAAHSGLCKVGFSAQGQEALGNFGVPLRAEVRPETESPERSHFLVLGGIFIR
jgi:hypothetical protein